MKKFIIPTLSLLLFIICACSHKGPVDKAYDLAKSHGNPYEIANLITEVNPEELSVDDIAKFILAVAYVGNNVQVDDKFITEVNSDKFSKVLYEVMQRQVGFTEEEQNEFFKARDKYSFEPKD